MSMKFILNGDGAVTEEQLSDLRGLCLHWNNKAEHFFSRRDAGEKARKCEWDGQSPDGRCWDDENPDNPGIFDGCSDLRIRHAECTVLDKQATLLGALSMADMQIEASGQNAAEKGQAALNLARWICNRAGSEWYRSWMALTGWYLGDDPALALMEVRWEKNDHLEMRTVTLDEIAQMWLASLAEAAGGDDAALANAQQTVENGMAVLQIGEQEETYDQIAGVLVGVVSASLRISSSEARRLLKSVAADGIGDVAVPVSDGGRVRFLPRRFGSGFVVPEICTDFGSTSVWFVPEWITLDELRSRDWDEDFVNELEEAGPRAVFSDSWDALHNDITTSERRDMRQVVWAYVTACNRRGVRGRYVCCFAGGKETAFGWRLLRTGRGNWPAVLFQRELASEYATDARGISLLAAPDQGMIKTLWNGAGDNAMIGLTPPIVAKGRSARNQAVSPLKVIGMNVNEDFSFMNPPAYPAAGMRVAEKIEELSRDYFGRPRKDGDPNTVAQRQRVEVNWFLAQASDVLTRAIELAQDNMTDEELAEITDATGTPAGVTRELLSGRFAVTLRMTVEDLDGAQLISKIRTAGEIVGQLDRSRRVNTDPLVSALVQRLFPDIGAKTIRPEGSAQEEEIREEAKNLESIRAGVMPKMDTEGRWDYETRLSMYQQLQAQNPRVFDDMGDDKRQMLAQWMQALQMQATQFGANRQIGRTGVQGVEG